jgi:SprT protein
MNKFEILKKCGVAKDLKNRIETVVLDCLDKAQSTYGCSSVTKIPEIRFKTKGAAAGKAYWNGGNPYIDINPILLNENVEQVVNQTVPHEVAHIVVFELYLKCSFNVTAHGPEWQYVMKLFGKTPDRCHNMDVSTIRRMKSGAVFVYKCSCREHILSSIKHKRIQLEGRGYRCTKCKTPVAFSGTR